MPGNPFDNIATLSAIYDDDESIQELVDSGQLTTASNINRPEPTARVKEINLFNEFNIRNPKADGGMLVKPSADGSRPGYAGKPVTENIRLTPSGNAYEVTVKRGEESFYKTFRKDDYENAKDALNAAKKFRDQKKKILYKPGVQEPKYGSTSDIKEYRKRRYEETKILTDAGKLDKERDLKLKNFIGKKKKIKSSVLRDFVLNDVGYKKYDPSKIRKKFPNLIIEKDIQTGSDYTPLTKQQKTFVKDNFNLPEGVREWNFKKNKFGISPVKYPKLVAQINRRLSDSNQYKIAANFSAPEGWMMSAMNRVYENETTLLEDGTRVLKEGVDNLTYEPRFNKKGIIVGFKDNTAAGKGNTYYGLKKNAEEYGDSTNWRAHGDFYRVNKFLEIANGVKEQPDKILQKILKDKGLDKIEGLTLNDILSHERYYGVLAETSPRELIKRQVVLHHTRGVGDQNLARAAATKDLQLLTGAINSKVIELENIVKGTSTTPGRKLNAEEIKQLKNFGAKIQDFDGKIVGGGFIDPERQYANIEKQALKYAKGDQFNIKTVASYLERLGCGKAAGGRVFYNEGAMGLTKCAKKGQLKLSNIIAKGTGNKTEQLLATQILNAGRGLKNMTSLRALLGPQALVFFAATEAGLVGADMLMSGKTFKEAVADSLINPALGPKLKQDSKKLFVERLQNLGLSDQEIGKGLMFDRMVEDVETLDNLKQRKAIADQKVTQAEKFFPAVLDKRKKEASDVAMNIQDIYRTGDRNVLDAFEGKFQKPETQEIFEQAAAQKQALEELAAADQARAVAKNIYGKYIQGERGRKEDEELMSQYFDIAREGANPAFDIPGMREATGGYLYGFAGGGIAKIAGIDQGPQRTSMNPDSGGLKGILKRAMKLKE